MTHPGTLPSPESVERAMAADQSFTFDQAPTVKPGFHGALTFKYRAGRLVLVEISETLIPEGETTR